MTKHLTLLLFIGLVLWSCEEEVEPEDCAGVVGGNNICGCIDSTAMNYNSTATYDDGSCEYDTTVTTNLFDGIWILDDYLQCDLFRPNIDNSPIGQWGFGYGWSGTFTWELVIEESNQGTFAYSFDYNQTSFVATGECIVDTNNNLLTFNYQTMDTVSFNPANDWIERLNVPESGETEAWNYLWHQGGGSGSFMTEYNNTDSLRISKEWQTDEGDWTIYGDIKRIE